jgi:predicted glycoside hydrolase/deacetylase ChbG (UPF0249 family)
MLQLIVNADDLGRTPGINDGVAEAVDRGIVTSASVMVRWPAARRLRAWAAERPHVSLGLHVDIGELQLLDGSWQTVYMNVDPRDEAGVRREVREQLERFIDLVGMIPTHVDSHQHVHREQPVHDVVAELASELGVPLRSYSPTVRYDGRFYGQTRDGSPWPGGISVEALVALLGELPPGTTELGCHPGRSHGLRNAYCAERDAELRTLCDPRVHDAIAERGITLVRYGAVGAVR